MTIRFHDMITEKEEWYILSRNLNLLLELNINTFKATPLAFFSANNYINRNYYEKVFLYHNKMYFFPFLNNATNVVAVYDITTATTSSTSFPLLNKPFANMKFEYILYKEKIWMFSRNYYYPLIIYDLPSNTFKLISDWNCSFKDLIYSTKSPLFINIIKNGNYVWFALTNSSTIVEMNLDNLNVKIHKLHVSKLNSNFHTLNFDGLNFWITLYNTPTILAYCPNDGSITEYWNENHIIQDKKNIYNIMIFFDNNIFLIPTHGKYLYILNKFTKQITIGPNFECIYEQMHYVREKYTYSKYVIIKNKLYLFPSQEYLMLIIDADTYKITGSYIRCNKNSDSIFNTLYSDFKLRLNKSEICKESDLCNIDLELLIKSTIDITKQTSSSFAQNGKYIYHTVKSSIL